METLGQYKVLCLENIMDTTKMNEVKQSWTWLAFPVIGRQGFTYFLQS